MAQATIYDVPDIIKYDYIMQQNDVDYEIKDLLLYLVEEKGDFNGTIDFTMFRDNFVEMWKDQMPGIDMLYELFPQFEDMIDTVLENERLGRISDVQKYNMIIRREDVSDVVKEMLAEIVQEQITDTNTHTKRFDFYPIFFDTFLPLWVANAQGIDVVYELYPQVRVLLNNFETFGSLQAQGAKRGGKIKRYFVGGLIEKGKELLFGKNLPKKVRKYLEKYGDEYITDIVLYRTPIDQVSNMFLNFLTLGSWDDIKRKGGVDKLFHTYMVINGKHLLEKNQTINMSSSIPAKTGETETFVIQNPKAGGLTINDLMSDGEKYMGRDKFLSYDGFKNNCQDFLLGLLKGSGIAEGATQFLKQDIKKLVENTPSLSQYIGKTITDVAGKVDEIAQEIIFKRGGCVRPKKFIR
jgi:urease gamma subunit